MTVDEAAVGIGLELGELAPRDRGVFVNRFLRGDVPVAFAEAAVIDREHGEAEVVQLLDAEELAGEVPARAMQIEERRRLLPGRPPPRMDVLGHAVGDDWQVDFLYF